MEDLEFLSKVLWGFKQLPVYLASLVCDPDPGTT